MVEGSAFFLFCHDDVRLEPDAPSMMVEAAFRTNAGVVTPKVVAYEDPLVLAARRPDVRPLRGRPRAREARGDRPRPTGPRTRRLRRARRRHARAHRPLRDAARLRPVDHRPRRGPRPVLARPDRRRAHRGRPRGQGRAPRDDRLRRAPVTALGTRRASRQDLQRRHQLLVVATGWGRRYAFTTLFALFLMDSMEFVPRDRRTRQRPRGRHPRLVAVAGPQSTPDPRAPSSAPRDPGPLRRGVAPAAGRRRESPQTLRRPPDARGPRPRARHLAARGARDPRVRRRRRRVRGRLLRGGGVRRDPRQRHDGAAQPPGADT